MTSPFEGHDHLPTRRIYGATSRPGRGLSAAVRVQYGAEDARLGAPDRWERGAQPPVRRALARAYGRLMDQLRTMERTQVAIDGGSYFLAPGEDRADLKQRIEQALRAGGGFVDFRATGERDVSVLISSHSHVVITVETVPPDSSDDLDAATQFEGVFDLL